MTLISVTYLNPPKDNSAGTMFSYNFEFFFPMLAISSLMGLMAVIYLFRFLNDLKNYEIKYKKLRIIATLLLLLPMFVHLIPLLILFIL